MSHRTMPLAVVCLALTALAAPAADATKDKTDLNDLGLEVAALQLIYQFELTPRQLQALADLSKNAAAASERKPAKGSDKLRGLLLELRAALRKHDDTKIDELTEKVDALKEKEKADLDDGVTATDAARKAAVEMARLLTARQTLAYLNLYEELPDPLATVREALKNGAKLKNKDWTSLRDAAVAEVAWLMAGFDKDRAEKVSAQTAVFLDAAHAWKDTESAEAQAEVEKTLREIGGDGGPAEVLRHIVERDLAELLANPRLAAALEEKRQR